MGRSEADLLIAVLTADSSDLFSQQTVLYHISFLSIGLDAPGGWVGGYLCFGS